MTGVSDSAGDPRGRRPWGLLLLIGALGLLGLVARLRFLLLPTEEVFRGFPTEDGYLMLTVARNLALGNGMSTAAGTLPTNGVQPLATLVQALAFTMVGGDREAGLRLLIGIYTLLAVATAVLIARLGRHLIGRDAEARRAAWLGAAVWFTSPVTLFHTMNMLETGLYAGAVVAVSLYFARGHASDARWPWSRCATLGGLLGLAFWARNDAVLLMAAVGVTHLSTARSWTQAKRRAAETALMALVVLLVALPWLTFNLRGFGSVVPISGHAYLGAGSVMAGLSAAAVALFEYLVLVFSWKYSPLQVSGPFVTVCGAVVGMAALWLSIRLLRRDSDRSRSATWWMPAVFCLALVGFYVFFFDAPHFVRRYLFAASPFLALLWGWATVRLRRGLGSSSRARFLTVPTALMLVTLLYLQSGMAHKGPWQQGFFRAVEWIDLELAEDVWVGALQSGTIGFFHDRTINLDGKVNPEALAAVKASLHAEYVLDSKIEYVVDWTSLLEPWAAGSPALLDQFEWVLLDRENNLAALRRRAAIPRSSTASP